MTDTSETYTDQVLNFTIPSRDARGRIVRLDKVLDEILAAHSYPAPIAHLLAEAVTLTALMGGLVKEEGAQMTMQAQSQEGIVRLMVCDFRAGEIRGYVEYDRARLDDLGINPSLETLFGDGYLAITFDRAKQGGRYQGIVPLEGASLSSACENYFFQSEQVPTLIRIAVRREGQRTVASGLLIQHLPDGEEGRERLHARLDHPQWEHVATMAGSIRHDELLDRALSMEALVWRLFHEEDAVRVRPGVLLERGCRCTAEHYESILSRFSEEERVEMRDEKGLIQVDCAFCAKVFPIAL